MRITSPKLSRRGYVAITIAAVLVPTLFLSLLGLHLVRRHALFQSEILNEYSRFSVEYAASEIEESITSQERDIANYLQLVALVDGFDPAEELRRAELNYPLIENVFARTADGELVFARWLAVSAAAPEEARHASERDAVSRQRAERILHSALDEATYQHLMLSGTLHYYTGKDGDEPYQLVMFPYRDAHNVERGVIGFFLDEEELRKNVVGKVLEQSIDTAKGRFAPDFGKVLTLVVRDGKDQVVHTHRRPDCPPHEAQKPCPKRDLARASLGGVLPGWNVGITYTRPAGFAWTGRIVYLQVGLLLLAAAIVVVGTLVTMRFVLRQMELSRMKSHFVSNITHELKTPLAAIQLYTETLQQGRIRDSGDAGRFLGIIHKEVGRLTSLINNILDFARIEDGRRRYKFTVAGVGDIVQEIIESYSYQLHEKGFEVELDIEPNLPETRVDRDAVGQAVLNLLDNAVKYSRDVKELQVRVLQSNGNGGAGESASNGHSTIRIEVSDRGIGIPAVEQERIFEAFYRVDKGLEHDVKGSGLGLAVVKHIADAHGGTVVVDGRPGGGSRFTLTLPVVEAGA
jgi:signal transduction histidine kinase